MAAEFVIPWGSYFEIGSMVYDLAALAFGLPDPMDLFIGLFSGRPTLQATADIASLLNHYSSPVLKLLGLGAAASLNAGIPVSSSAGDPIFGPYFEAAVRIEDGIRWGQRNPTSANLDTITLAAVMHEAGNPGNAGTATIDAVQQAWEMLIAGKPQSGDPTNYFTQLANNPLQDQSSLLISGWATRYLNLHPQPQPQPQPSPPPPPPPPPQDPYQMQWFGVCQNPADCLTLSEESVYLGQMLNNVSKSLREFPYTFAAIVGDPTAVATANLETALKHHLNAIHQVLKHIKEHMAPAMSLLEVKASLDCICKAIEVTAGSGLDLTPINTALATIALNTAPADHGDITAAINRLHDDNFVPAGWVTALINSGAVPAEFSALLQGTTWEQVIATAVHFFAWLVGAGESEIEPALGHVYNKVIVPFINAVYHFWTSTIPAIDTVIEPERAAVQSLTGRLLIITDKLLTGIFGFAFTTILQVYESDLVGIDTTTDAGVDSAVSRLLSRCLEMGLSAELLAKIPELAYFTKYLGLDSLAKFIEELAGFSEVIHYAHGPFLEAKLGRPAQYSFNRRYQTALPPVGIAARWFGRRLLPGASVTHVAQSAGYTAAWQSIFESASYRPVQPRALATLLQDAPVNAAELTSILEDNSVRPQDVNFMLDAFTYASTKNLRNSYASETITAYAKGFISLADFHDTLANIGWSTDAVNFATQRANLQQQVIIAETITTEVITQVANGAITPGEGEQALEAAGVQPWKAKLEISIATTRAEIHALKLAEQEAAREARENQRYLTRAAIAEFQAGRLDAAGLAAALEAIP